MLPGLGEWRRNEPSLARLRELLLLVHESGSDNEHLLLSPPPPPTPTVANHIPGCAACFSPNSLKRLCVFQFPASEGSETALIQQGGNSVGLILVLLLLLFCESGLSLGKNWFCLNFESFGRFLG